MKKSDHFPVHLYNKVKEFRKAFSYSQIALAEKVHITRGNLFKIEQGQIIPSVLIAIQLAKYLHTTVEELFTFEKVVELNEYEKREIELKEILIKNGILKEEDR